MFTTPFIASAILAIGASAQTYKASFTEYGSGDSVGMLQPPLLHPTPSRLVHANFAPGSPNCNTLTNACGDYTSPGYAAAVSQNLYGVGPGAGAGPACNTCWKLTAETDSSGNKLSNAGNSIVVKVNNLCPGKCYSMTVLLAETS